MRGHQHARDKSIPRNAPTQNITKSFSRSCFYHTHPPPSRPTDHLPHVHGKKKKGKHSSTFIRWTARSTAKCHGESQRRERRRVRARCDRVDARAKLGVSLPRGSEDTRRTGLRSPRPPPRGRRPVRPELTGSLPAVHHSQD